MLLILPSAFTQIQPLLVTTITGNILTKAFFFHLVGFFLRLIISFERVGGREQGRGQKRGRERIPSRFHTVSTEPNTGLQPTNRGIMT